MRLFVSKFRSLSLDISMLLACFEVEVNERIKLKKNKQKCFRRCSRGGGLNNTT